MDFCLWPFDPEPTLVPQFSKTICGLNLRAERFQIQIWNILSLGWHISNGWSLANSWKISAPHKASGINIYSTTSSHQKMRQLSFTQPDHFDGGWTNPFEHMRKSNWIISPWFRGEHETKIFEVPPPEIHFWWVDRFQIQRPPLIGSTHCGKALVCRPVANNFPLASVTRTCTIFGHWFWIRGGHPGPDMPDICWWKKSQTTTWGV